MTYRIDWVQDANCATTDPDLFFSEQETYATAKKVCDFCPVRALCLEEALEMDEVFGLRGGMTPNERKQLKRRNGLAA